MSQALCDRLDLGQKMKKIRTIIPYYVNVCDAAKDMGSKLHEVYLENAKNIVFSALSIEEILARGIGKYFFGEEYNKRKIFDDLMISTDSFSFSAKRRAFIAIASEQGILSGSTRTEYENLISRIIRYRNMFTHGAPVYNGSNCVLHFSSGGKQEMTLTDEVFEKIEKELALCFHRSEEIALKIEKIT